MDKLIDWDDKSEFEKIFKDTIKQEKDERFSSLYQPIVIFKKLIKKGLFKKEIIPLSFYCDRVFIQKNDAQKFLRNFINALIKDGSLNKEEITDKSGNLNSEKIICGVQTLYITSLVE